MKRRKITAAITALACCVGMAAYMPQIAEKNGSVSAEAVSNDFEVTYEGWHTNSDYATIEAQSGVGVGMSRGMLVRGRTTPADGASSSKGFYLVGGIEYTYSVWVSSRTNEKFHLSLRCLDEETDAETKAEIASQDVYAGEWTELTGTFTAPENSYEFELTITTDSTNDFAFDNVKITTKEDPSTVYAAGNGLKDAFNGYGFRVGNILNGGTVKNSAICANILKDCNAVECENETKADAVLRANGSTDTNVNISLDNCAAIADFCAKNDIAFRGHAFVWHSQTPVWFFKEGFNSNGNWVSKSTMDQRLESYIKNVFAAFEKQYPTLNIYAYDVCNECINDATGGPREPGDNNVEGGKSGYVAVYGDNSFIETAFTYARKYAPEGCKLYYNDFNEFAGTKKNGIINSILKPLSAKGVLDGMGMQSHINAAATNAWGDTVSYLNAMDEYLSLGIDVQVTELDISLENGQTLNDQANKYKAIVEHIIEANTSGKYKGKVTLFQVWGPNDANTWISGDKSPTLYDKNNDPKLAYTTLMSLGDGNGPFEGFDTPLAPPEIDEDGYWFHHTFEGTDNGWEGRGGASILTSGRYAYADKESLLVQERTDEWNGAIYTLGRAFEAGQEYSFSVNVTYADGAESRDFKLTLEYTDASGETTWDEIAVGTTSAGQWVQLANTNYKIPDGASNYKIIVETTDGSLENFYIDEAIGAPAGTKIDGAGQPAVRKLIYGDVDCNGIINALDVAMARKAAVGNITDSLALKAADVDRSGKVDGDDIKQINDFVLGRITEFEIAKQVIDNAAMEALFSGVTPAKTYKTEQDGNVLYTQRFGADPGWMVYKDRLYVYTTNDAFEYDSNGQIKENTYDVGTINCISSADLVNWTDHGAIPVAGRNGRTTGGAAAWASNSWAPDACWKTIDGKDKFFLYFADNGSGIGVLTADSPTGPWTDPLGHQIISRSTPNCGNVTWLFDPGVYYDEETGKGYLAFGGGVPEGKSADPGTGRIVELGSDMTSIVGTPTTLNPPYLFEDSSLIKINGKWIYSFCHNWSVPGGTSINGHSFGNADIGYMTSDSPLGPYTYNGVAFKNTANGLDNGGNNHHSIIEFKNKYYVLYHTRRIEMNMGVNDGKGLNYRSPGINEATVNGSSISCTGSRSGLKQLETLNPYGRVEAETMSNQGGINVSGVGNTVVTDIDKGDWIQVSGVEFSKGASALTVNVSSKNGAAIKVATGSTTGEAIAYVDVPAGGMTEITVPCASVSGTKDIYFVFSGQCEFDWWSFS